MCPLKIWMHPLGICKISKPNMLISLLTKHSAPLYSHVSSVEPLRLEKETHFQKCTFMQDFLCNVKEHKM